MNILQALGGVGSGLMLAQKVNAEQEDRKLRKTESDLRLKQVQQGVDANAKAQADDDSQRAIFTTRDAVKKRILAGDQTAIDEGANEYNKNSGAFADGKTVRFTQSLPDGGRAGVVVDRDGKEVPFSMSLSQIAGAYDRGTLMQIEHSNPNAFKERMSSAAKALAEQAKLNRSEYVSGGDGTVFDKHTGEKKGTPTPKFMTVAPGGTVLDGSGKKVYQAQYRPASQSQAGGSDGSKGAKYDQDSDGYRIILQRDGTMVYPKDKDGNVVKIKVGTDADQKFVRALVQASETKRYPVSGEDPVARARDLANQTGAPPPKEAAQGTQPAKAPQSALDYLKKNPSQKEAFEAKYGYLPEGV